MVHAFFFFDLTFRDFIYLPIVWEEILIHNMLSGLLSWFH